METQIIRSFSLFGTLREEWDELAGVFNQPLLRHDWYSCAAHAFHGDGDLRIVLVRRGGRLTAAAPLVLVRSNARERLELLGGSALYEPSGLLFADSQSLAVLLREIARLGLPLLLNRIETTSVLPEMVGTCLAPRVLAFQRSTCPSLAVEISGEWADYVQGLSAELRSSLRRKRRRATQLGKVVTETLSPQSHEVDALLDCVMRVEASGWKGRRGSAMLSKERLGVFFRTYCKLAAARGELRISRLYFGLHVAAVEVSLEAHGRMWQLKIGFQETFAKFSPGQLLTFDTLAHAFAKGLTAFEFLGSAEPWEERWKPVPRHYMAIRAYPMSARGLWGLSADVAIRAKEFLRFGPRATPVRPGI